MKLLSTCVSILLIFQVGNKILFMLIKEGKNTKPVSAGLEKI
jgi:hypothetical protein